MGFASGWEMVRQRTAKVRPRVPPPTPRPCGDLDASVNSRPVPTADRPPLVLLHGLLGAPSDWDGVRPRFEAAGHAVYAPALPTTTGAPASVAALAEQTAERVRARPTGPVVLVGNSLGGHLAVLLAGLLRDAPGVHAVVLTGASGLYEVPLGASTPRRHDRAYLRARIAETFFDPAHATDALVARVHAAVSARDPLRGLLRLARATRHPLTPADLAAVRAPALLVWGRDDRVTPPSVAEAYARALPDARLVWLDRCGHAPMIEHPGAFARAVLGFLATLRCVPLEGHFSAPTGVGTAVVCTIDAAPQRAAVVRRTARPGGHVG